MSVDATDKMRQMAKSPIALPDEVEIIFG